MKTPRPADDQQRWTKRVLAWIKNQKALLALVRLAGGIAWLIWTLWDRSAR